MNTFSEDAEHDEVVEAEVVRPTAGSREEDRLVSDVLIGFNTRKRDNVIQAVAILACATCGAVLGALLVRERIPAALVGGFLGLLVGLFGSGIWLMVYRIIRHSRGQHD